MDKATAGQKYKEAVEAVILNVYRTGVFDEHSGGGVKPLDMLKAFREAGGTEEELQEIWRDINSRELELQTHGTWDGQVVERQVKQKRTYDNIIDQVMRLPATEFNGPKDPRMDTIINYIRQQKARGEKAKRSEFADPDVLATEGRRITKPKTFRRM